MQIGVPKETAPRERRVALAPDSVGRLVKSGTRVVVEHDGPLPRRLTGDPAGHQQHPSPARQGRATAGDDGLVFAAANPLDGKHMVLVIAGNSPIETVRLADEKFREAPYTIYTRSRAEN